MVVNTRMNQKGQPILEIPFHATDSFIRCELYVLMLKNRLVLREDQNEIILR